MASRIKTCLLPLLIHSFQKCQILLWYRAWERDQCVCLQSVRMLRMHQIRNCVSIIPLTYWGHRVTWVWSCWRHKKNILGATIVMLSSICIGKLLLSLSLRTWSGNCDLSESPLAYPMPCTAAISWHTTRVLTYIAYMRFCGILTYRCVVDLSRLLVKNNLILNPSSPHRALAGTRTVYCRDRSNCSGTPAGPKGYNRGALTEIILKRAPEQLQWWINYNDLASTCCLFVCVMSCFFSCALALFSRSRSIDRWPGSLYLSI